MRNFDTISNRFLKVKVGVIFNLCKRSDCFSCFWRVFKRNFSKYKISFNEQWKCCKNLYWLKSSRRESIKSGLCSFLRITFVSNSYLQIEIPEHVELTGPLQAIPLEVLNAIPKESIEVLLIWYVWSPARKIISTWPWRLYRICTTRLSDRQEITAGDKASVGLRWLMLDCHKILAIPKQVLLLIWLVLFSSQEI